MQRICDICGKNEATLFDRIIENNIQREYAYCQSCYDNALRTGRMPSKLARERILRRGLECDSCGYSIERFNETFLFGCPDCYRYMSGVALKAARRQAAVNFDVLYSASPDDIDINNNAVSSRIRLARNIEGLPFPHLLRGKDDSVINLIRGAMLATDGVFDAKLYPMTSLSDLQKKALIERHIISLPLANNPMGAVITESGENSEISVMLNEEDHIREQCTVDGFALSQAYQKLKAYDLDLTKYLPIAYDRQFGYLTACPSNVGTGMRASVMLFLPALKRTGAINGALSVFKKNYALTVRGYFGEGSDAAYEMYQVSNSRTFEIDEAATIYMVEKAAKEICRLEREALAKLLQRKRTQIIDKIFRSYGLLESAYSLTSKELMDMLPDVKLGVILDVLPIKSMAPLNELIRSCASSLDIINDGISEEQRNISRASKVRDCLKNYKGQTN